MREEDILKKISRILLLLCCLCILAAAWYFVIVSKSDSQKQEELIRQAEAYLEDKIYIRAIPLLEEASAYEAAHTAEAEKKLKEVYLKMMPKQGYEYSYLSLLEKQMKRKGAPAEVFAEAAEYYLSESKLEEALAVLRRGLEAGEESLRDRYEKHRYAYETGYNTYDEVTEIFNKTIAVQNNGLWGLASSGGDLLIPCEYEKISTYSSEVAIVRKDGEIYAVNEDNDRVALLKEEASDFGNYANEWLSLKTKEGWKRATAEFRLGAATFEEIGMYSEGYAPAKKDGKWGLIDFDGEWTIPPEYEDIVRDDLGRAYHQGAVFIREGSRIWLFVEGEKTDHSYEDAKPFNPEGYAAVKQDGKWGYIDAKGELKIDFRFEEAKSFGRHLAAVKEDDRWGYISIYGKMAIPPIFSEAKTFSDGKAPVRTDSGWQFIRLIEYQRGGLW